MTSLGQALALSPAPHVALLTRHRWLGDPVGQTYICTPGIPSLYRSYDPTCSGCGSRIPWSSLRGLERYRGVSDPRNKLLGEALGVRLDLKICELAVEKHQREVWKRAS